MTHTSTNLKRAAMWAVGIISPYTVVLFDRKSIDSIPLWLAVVPLIIFGTVIIGLVILAYLLFIAQ